jgi:hypothetical protein
LARKVSSSSSDRDRERTTKRRRVFSTRSRQQSPTVSTRGRTPRQNRCSSLALHRLVDAIALDPSPPSVTYGTAWGGTVTLVTKRGERFTRTVHAPRGSAPRAIAWTDIEAKYRDLMSRSGLSAAQVTSSFQMIQTMESLTRIRSPDSSSRRAVDPRGGCRRKSCRPAPEDSPRDCCWENSHDLYGLPCCRGA